MEYFIGSFLTLVSVYFMNKLVSKKFSKKITINVPKFNQSRYFEMTKYMYKPNEVSFMNKLVSQATKHFDSRSTRVLYMDGFAWFIKKIDGINTLHNAVIVDGSFDENSIKRVDTMGMDDVELKKTIFIVEKLTEGIGNDSGNSGK